MALYWQIVLASIYATLFIQPSAGKRDSSKSTLEKRQTPGVPFTWNGVNYSCKCYDDNTCWPSSADWTTLNTTVGGALQYVIPDGAVCHNTFEGRQTYNQAACQVANSNLASQTWQSDRAVSNHNFFWTNMTCQPTNNPSESCTIGFLPRYVIIATQKEHVKAGVDFAREHNLRLIIRNTGHDYLGRSTGYGSLAINTHRFKDVQFISQYTGPGDYRGTAVTVGAGIQARDLLRLANQQNPKQIVVTGECPTVGFAGGYLLGGGHGPLVSLHGMAADQALSFEAVTADGQIVTANADTNPDLFWALKGGGPSTFAVLVSVTVKTFADTPTAGILLDINTQNQDLFWKGFRAFHNLANHWVDNGMYAYYVLFPGFFQVQPLVGPNMNRAKINELAQPLFDALRQDGVPYTTSTSEYSTFFDLYIALFTDESANAGGFVGGRIFTHQDITENGDGIVAAVRQAGGHIGHIVGPGYGAPVVDNAINPVWRNASSFGVTSVSIDARSSFDQRAAAERRLTNDVDGPVRAASPHGAAYVNEGNLAEPNWQTAYWGTNYPRLKELKAKWDPQGVFYARTTPGTEDWDVIDFGRRLCKKA